MTIFDQISSGTHNSRPVTPANWKTVGCVHDEEYNMFRASMQQHYMKVTDEGTKPVFTTSAMQDDSLWQLYIGSFPYTERGYHNCRACERFITRFGGLVVIDDNGKARSAVWNASDAPAIYANGIAAMQDEVEQRSTVTGVFYSPDRVWGLPKDGKWTHYSLNNLARFIENPNETADQAMALRKEEFSMVGRAIADYPAATVATALKLLRSGNALYRAEKVIGPVEWFDTLLAARAGVRTAGQKQNLLWRAIATAPIGFAHLRGGMAGTLLDDIKEGLPYQDVAAKFADKMNALKYLRPQAAPKAGAIAQAEKLVQAYGIEPSLMRRLAKLHEIETFWTPSARQRAPVNSGGVFGHIKPKSGGAAAPGFRLPQLTMTWVKFVRDILPTTARMFVVLGARNYSLRAFTTAVHVDAPPILQWDMPERRNPVAGYVYHGGSSPSQFALSTGRNEVLGLTRDPAEWYGGGSSRNRSEQVIFLLPGYDKRVAAGFHVGNALFPEVLKSELHGVRSVIEAYSKTAKLGNAAMGDAIGLSAGGNDMGVNLVAIDGVGNEQDYLIDRFE